MFLTDLDAPKKELFLELLILLLMYERVEDIEYDDVLESNNKEPLLLPFTAAINTDALTIVKKVANRIGKNGLVENFYEDLNATPSSQYGALFGNLTSSIFGGLAGSEQKKESSQNWTQSYDYSLFRDLRRTLVDITQAKIDEYSQNTHVRQAVINEITQSGIDFFSINPKVIQIFTANLDQIRQEILLQTAETVVEKKKIEGIELSNKEKKIYLYNLLYFCIDGNKDLDGEHASSLLKAITLSLGLDLAYIDEFKSLVKQYVQIEQELVILIKE